MLPDKKGDDDYDFSGGVLTHAKGGTQEGEEVRLELNGNVNSKRCYITEKQKKEYNKVYRENNREKNKDAIKGYEKIYREKNKDAIKEKRKLSVHVDLY